MNVNIQPFSIFYKANDGNKYVARSITKWHVPGGFIPPEF